jgi:nicotinamide mononucleotide transporter
MEILAVLLAVIYLLLAIRENRWCWPAGIGSALLYLGVFYAAGLYMEAALQLFYVGMGFYGWWAWRPAASPEGAPLTIHRWPLGRHGAALLGIAALSLTSGWALERYTDAAAPYLDSFVTWSAVLTTWMVARKLLENWLYWFVIDGVTLGLALERGLHLTAALFALYLVLVIIGWRAWLVTWRRTAVHHP